MPDRCSDPKRGKRLKSVDIPAEPLTLDELRQRGNELVTEAWRAAIDALAVSTRVNIYHRPGGLDIYGVRSLRAQADEAVSAWTKVSGALGELEKEFSRAKAKYWRADQ